MLVPSCPGWLKYVPFFSANLQTFLYQKITVTHRVTMMLCVLSFPQSGTMASAMHLGEQVTNGSDKDVESKRRWHWASGVTSRVDLGVNIEGHQMWGCSGLQPTRCWLLKPRNAERSLGLLQLPGHASGLVFGAFGQQCLHPSCLCSWPILLLTLPTPPLLWT